MIVYECPEPARALCGGAEFGARVCHADLSREVFTPETARCLGAGSHEPELVRVHKFKKISNRPLMLFSLEVLRIPMERLAERYSSGGEQGKGKWTERDGKGRKGTERDGKGRKGTERDGKGRKGTERDGMELWQFISYCNMSHICMRGIFQQWFNLDTKSSPQRPSEQKRKNTSQDGPPHACRRPAVLGHALRTGSKSSKGSAYLSVLPNAP